MNIEVITEPFHYVKIVGLYSKEERKQIMRESLSINELGGFVNPSKTGTAHGENNENRKKPFLWTGFFQKGKRQKY